MKNSIELLAPARDLACGIAAIDHGADAVYIGATRFGARQAAGNSVEDIQTLCAYAHQYGARIYVTLNTILYDEELEETRNLAWDLYRAGVDAFIVQDMALLKMDMPPVPLHASTQMDNRTSAKVKWLRSLGFQQVVLARELSLRQIESIHKAVPDVSIEAFVHGALCVSYSGRCYASQYCFQRSANRGACAQFCRLPFNLIDADGRTILHDCHPLSLRDMNRSASLEAMMDAGVRSFKIEGRLKDIAYVKNVTSFYRQEIDKILKRRTDLQRTSWGTSQYTFTPNLSESFSRGYTDYFLHGRTEDLASMDSPKSRGPEVGFVKDVRNGCIVVAGTAAFSNGDGLCFMDEQGQMQGFRINRAEGNHLYPAKMPRVKKGDTLWRSHNQAWQTQMEGATARRTMSLQWTLKETDNGFLLQAKREDGVEASQSFTAEHQLARSPQDDTIRQVLAKLGDTCYTTSNVDIDFAQPWFIPRSSLAEWRRIVLSQLPEPQRIDAKTAQPTHDPESPVVDCINVSNRLSRNFYSEQGCDNIPSAMELRSVAASTDESLMTCRYCLRYQLGWCPTRQKNHSPYREPYFLVGRDGRRFRLEFDCQRCEMTVHADE